MKKYYLFALLFATLFLSNIATGSTGENSTIKLEREIQAVVDQTGQQQELLIPAEPLDFDTTLNWEFTIAKKGLTAEKQAAYFVIEETGADPKQLQKSTVSNSGKLTIPKGTRYKVTLNAGEYSRLIAKTGAEVKANLKYTEALIEYSQGDQPYLFNFEIKGPAGIKDWRWEWGNNQTSNGSQVKYQFDRDGKVPVVVIGTGGAMNGEDSHNFYFEMDVPPLIVLNPKVEPLSGPVELTITGQANAIVNYGQKALYTWNFGNGSELTGPDAKNTYLKPGKYLLTLRAKVNESNIVKTWLIEAAPISVNTNMVLTPTSGPVPLEVKGSVTPKVLGGPSQLQFTWDVAGEKIEATGFTKKITEPGEYQVVLKTVDRLHPELSIPDEVTFIKALMPQISLVPQVSLAKGIIPLTASFDPGVKVEGSPIDLVYHWDFGDGEISNEIKPKHVYKKSGEYLVQLVVNDRLHPGNLVSASLLMSVLPPEMKVKAHASVTKGIVPCTVNFNAQVGVTGSPCEPLYIWNFGDGATSYEQNPTHTFRQEGVQTVTLEVKDRLHPENIVKTTLEIETRMPKIRLTASVTPTSGKAPLSIQCRAWAEKEGASNPNLKYIWDFDDGEKAEGLDQRHTYEKKGTYNVTVTVEDQELGVKEAKSYKVIVK
ncbi:MAG: PKD domain-containing protein [Bacteroidota bacterium]